MTIRRGFAAIAIALLSLALSGCGGGGGIGASAAAQGGSNNNTFGVQASSPDMPPAPPSNPYGTN